DRLHTRRPSLVLASRRPLGPLPGGHRRPLSRPAPDRSIAARLSAVEAAIARAAERVRRDPGSVRIVAVTKGVGLEPIREALALGLRTLGENRVQEALAKIEAFADEAHQWHLVGHLQSNKARQAAEL